MAIRFPVADPGFCRKLHEKERNWIPWIRQWVQPTGCLWHISAQVSRTQEELRLDY